MRNDWWYLGDLKARGMQIEYLGQLVPAAFTFLRIEVDELVDLAFRK